MSEATQSKTLEYYMGLPYEVVIKHDDQGWFARVPDLPGCMTQADTFEELEALVEDAKRGYIEDSLEHGDPVPEPRDLGGYSGKVNLRMPKALHRDLARMAEAEGVSLNSLMVAALAREVGSSSEASRHTFDEVIAHITTQAQSATVAALEQAGGAAGQVSERAGEVAGQASERAGEIARRIAGGERPEE